jgi:photosystem I 4.8kDa protein
MMIKFTILHFPALYRLGTYAMTSKQAKAKADVPTTGKPPYPFRTTWALILLAGNFVVAAYYFGILK